MSKIPTFCPLQFLEYSTESPGHLSYSEDIKLIISLS